MSVKSDIGLSVLMIGLALVGAGLWLLLSPPEYRAVAVIRIEEDVDVILLNDASCPYDPYFMATELKIISSDVVLKRAVEALNLDEVWGKRYGNGGAMDTSNTIEFLRNHLDLTAERNTKIIEIGFTDKDPEEAAAIANGVAYAYTDFRIQRHEQQMQAGIKILEGNYQTETTNIETGKLRLEQLGKQLNLTNPIPSDDVLKANYPTYYEARQKLDDEEKLHERLKMVIDADKDATTIPKNTLVEKIEPAVAPTVPSGPNRRLGVVLLVCGVAMSGFGFYWLVGGRKERMKA